MKRVKRGWLFISLISIGLIAAIGLYTAQRFKRVVSISASELMKHYSEDAYGANKKYSDSPIIVKGQIKRIERKELSHLGFVNQFRYVIVLSVSYAPLTKSDDLFDKIRINSNVIRCSFERDQAYSLRNLEIYDFVEIHGDGIVLLKERGALYLNIDNCVLVKHSTYNDHIRTTQER